MIGSPNLMGALPCLQEKIDATIPGMAHFAELDGRICGTCIFWGGKRPREAQPSRCAKARRMGCKVAAGLPHDTPACKHHEPRPQAAAKARGPRPMRLDGVSAS
jgi:hypothetical protein